MTYQIDINLNTEQLEEFNNSLLIGLKGFRDAINNLDLATKKIAIDADFNKEIKQVRDALKVLGDSLKVSILSINTGDIQTAVNSLSEKIKNITVNSNAVLDTTSLISGLNTSVTALSTAINNLQVNSVQTAVNNLAQKVNNATNELDVTGATINISSIQTAVNNSIDELSRGLAGLNTDKLQTAINQIGEKVTTIADTILAVNGGESIGDEAVLEIEKQLKKTANNLSKTTPVIKLTDLQAAIKSLETKINTAVSGLDINVSGIERSIDDIGVRVGQVDVTSIQEGINVIGGKISSTSVSNIYSAVDSIGDKINTTTVDDIYKAIDNVAIDITKTSVDEIYKAINGIGEEISTTHVHKIYKAVDGIALKIGKTHVNNILQAVDNIAVKINTTNVNSIHQAVDEIGNKIKEVGTTGISTSVDGLGTKIQNSDVTATQTAIDSLASKISNVELTKISEAIDTLATKIGNASINNINSVVVDVVGGLESTDVNNILFAIDSIANKIAETPISSIYQAIDGIGGKIDNTNVNNIYSAVDSIGEGIREVSVNSVYDAIYDIGSRIGSTTVDDIYKAIDNIALGIGKTSVTNIYKAIDNIGDKINTTHTNKIYKAVDGIALKIGRAHVNNILQAVDGLAVKIGNIGAESVQQSVISLSDKIKNTDTTSLNNAIGVVSDKIKETDVESNQEAFNTLADKIKDIEVEKIINSINTLAGKVSEVNVSSIATAIDKLSTDISNTSVSSILTSINSVAGKIGELDVTSIYTAINTLASKVKEDNTSKTPEEVTATVSNKSVDLTFSQEELTSIKRKLVASFNKLNKIPEEVRLEVLGKFTLAQIDLHPEVSNALVNKFNLEPINLSKYLPNTLKLPSQNQLVGAAVVSNLDKPIASALLGKFVLNTITLDPFIEPELAKIYLNDPTLDKYISQALDGRLEISSQIDNILFEKFLDIIPTSAIDKTKEQIISSLQNLANSIEGEVRIDPIRIGADDILTGLSFDPVDLTEIIRQKLSTEGLKEELTTASVDVTQLSEEDKAYEVIQKAKIEDILNAFAEVMESSTSALNEEGKGFVKAFSSLKQTIERFTILARATDGFEWLATQIRRDTSLLGEALGEITTAMRHYAGEVGGVAYGDSNVTKPTSMTTDDLFSHEIASTIADYGQRGNELALALQMIQIILQQQSRMSKELGMEVSLADLSKNDPDFRDVFQVIIEKGANALRKIEEGSNISSGSVISKDDFKNILGNFVNALINDKNTPTSTVDAILRKKIGSDEDTVNSLLNLRVSKLEKDKTVAELQYAKNRTTLDTGNLKATKRLNVTTRDGYGITMMLGDNNKKNQDKTPEELSGINQNIDGLKHVLGALITALNTGRDKVVDSFKGEGRKQDEEEERRKQDEEVVSSDEGLISVSVAVESNREVDLDVETPTSSDNIPPNPPNPPRNTTFDNSGDDDNNYFGEDGSDTTQYQQYLKDRIKAIFQLSGKELDKALKDFIKDKPRGQEEKDLHTQAVYGLSSNFEPSALQKKQLAAINKDIAVGINVDEDVKALIDELNHLQKQYVQNSVLKAKKAFNTNNKDNTVFNDAISKFKNEFKTDKLTAEGRNKILSNIPKAEDYFNPGESLDAATAKINALKVEVGSGLLRYLKSHQEALLRLKQFDKSSQIVQEIDKINNDEGRLARDKQNQAKDKVMLDFAKQKMDESKLKDDTAVLDLSIFNPNNLSSDAARLQLDKYKQAYLNFFKISDKSLKTKLQEAIKHFQDTGEKINIADNVATTDEDRTLISLYNKDIDKQVRRNLAVKLENSFREVVKSGGNLKAGLDNINSNKANLGEFLEPLMTNVDKMVKLVLEKRISGQTSEMEMIYKDKDGFEPTYTAFDFAGEGIEGYDAFILERVAQEKAKAKQKAIDYHKGEITRKSVTKEDTSENLQVLTRLDSQAGEVTGIKTLTARLKQAAKNMDEALFASIYTRLKAINPAIALEAGKAGKEELVKQYYKRLTQAYLDNNQVEIDRINARLVVLNANKANQARDNDVNNKLKELFKTLRHQIKTGDESGAYTTTAEIDKIKPVMGVSAKVDSDKLKLKRLSEEFEVALENLNFTAANSVLNEIKVINKSIARIKASRVKKAENKSNFDRVEGYVNQLKSDVNNTLDPSNNLDPDSFRGFKITNNSTIFTGVDQNSSTKQGRENALKIDKTIQDTNKYFENLFITYDNQKLAAAKLKAKLGDTKPLEELKEIADKPNSKLTNIDAIKLAYKTLVEAEAASINGLTKEQKQLRETANLKMMAAISDLSDSREEFIQDAINAVEKIRTDAINAGAPVIEGSDFDNSLKVISNRGEKALNKDLNGKGGVSDGFKLQDIAGLYYTIYNLVKNIRDFSAGIINAATSISSQIVKLNVVNSNNLKKTNADIANSIELAKKYGGSQSEYLKSISGFKTADIKQFDRYGSGIAQRYSANEVKTLTEGLGAAFNVNQLPGSKREEATTAVLQILSKGVVNAEEIRQQLANQIPGAVSLFAQSLGISGQQLNKRFDTGSIADTEIFKLGRLFKQLYGSMADNVNLNNEVYKLQGNAKDTATAATQPIGGVVLIGTQLLNGIFQGLKANGAAFTTGLLPVTLIMSSVIVKGLKNAFASNEIVKELQSTIAGSMRRNVLPLGVLGLSLGAATLGSAVLGTEGIDKTLFKVGEGLRFLIDAAVNGLQRLLGVKKEDGSLNKPNDLQKFTFEALPLTGLTYAGINLLGRGIKGLNISRPPIEIDPSTPALPSQSRKGFISTVRNFADGTVSAIKNSPELGRFGGEIVTAIALATVGYAAANTKFIDSYTKVTEDLIKALPKPIKGTDEGRTAKIDQMVEFEGNNSLNFDFIHNYFKNKTAFENFIQNKDNSLDNISTVDLKKLTEKQTPIGFADSIFGMSDKYKEALAQAANKALDKRLSGTGYKEGGFAGATTEAAIKQDFRNIEKIEDRFKSISNPENNALIKQEADILRARIKIENQKLFALRQSKTVSTREREEQEVVVSNLESELREKVAPITEMPANYTQIIKSLENYKQVVEDKKPYLDLNKEYKPQIEMLDKLLVDAKSKLTSANILSNLYDATTAVSDLLEENEIKLGIITKEEGFTKGNLASLKGESIEIRSKESNDIRTQLRQAIIASEEARVDLAAKTERADIAKQNVLEISGLPSSTTRDTKLKKAIEEETAAFVALKDATLAVTQAQLNQQQAIEEIKWKEFDKFVKNIGFTEPGGVTNINREVDKFKLSNREDNTILPTAQESEKQVQAYVSAAIARLNPEEKHRYLNTSLSVDGKLDLSIEAEKKALKDLVGKESQASIKSIISGLDSIKSISKNVKDTVKVDSVYKPALQTLKTTQTSSNISDPNRPFLPTNVYDTMGFGVYKAKRALEEFRNQMSSFKLTADEATYKLRELEAAVPLATLNLQEQKRGLNAERLDTNRLIKPNQYTEIDNDKFRQLIANENKAKSALQFNQDSIKDTRSALNTLKSPEERANLAAKLYQLETDAIRRKHEVELAAIDKARAGYSNIISLLEGGLANILNTSQNKTNNIGLISNTSLNNTNTATTSAGGVVTEARQALNTLNAKKEEIYLKSQQINLDIQSSISQFTSQLEPVTGKPLYGETRDIERYLKELTSSSGFNVKATGMFVADQFRIQKGLIDSNPAYNPAGVDIKGTRIPFSQMEALSKLLIQVGTLKETKQQGEIELRNTQNQYNVTLAKQQQQINDQLNTNKLLKTQIRNLPVEVSEGKKNLGLDLDVLLDQARIKVRPNNKINPDLPLNRDEGLFKTKLNEIERQYALSKQETNQLRTKFSTESLNLTPKDKLLQETKLFEVENRATLSRNRDREKAIIDAGRGLANLILNSFDTLSKTVELLGEQAKKVSDVINNKEGILTNLGLKSQYISDVIPVINEKNQTEQQIKQIKFDSSIYGDKDRAQLELSVIKQNNEILNLLKAIDSITKGGKGGIGNYRDGEQYKLQSDANKAKIDNIAAQLQGISPEKRDRFITQYKDLLRQSVVSITEVQNKRESNANREILLLQSPAKQENLRSGINILETGRTSSAFSTQNLADDKKVELYREQIKQLNLEFEKVNSNENISSAEKDVALFKRNTAIEEKRAEFEKLPIYGGRFLAKVEEAVNTASNLTGALRKAIEEGNWTNVFNDILTGIVNNLADSFGKDAQLGLSQIIGGSVKGLLGLPTLANGSPEFKRGSSYPHTPFQIPSEPRESRLAIINKDELVIPHTQVNDYLAHRMATQAYSSSNVNSNNSSVSNVNYYNTSNYKSTGDTFGRNRGVMMQEEQKRGERYS